MQLKADVFGTITREGAIVCRDTRRARPWAKWLARHLARREARALRALRGVHGVPSLIDFDGYSLRRSWMDGEPMHRAHPRDPAYFQAAFGLLRRLHHARVAHNDLAKEPNWLVTPGGEPALVDFQLALVSRRRSRLFRALARDDIRHLLKHKRTYCPQRLTAREKRILATPSVVSRIWRATGKKAYLFVTRRIFGWADREGAGDRRFGRE